MKKYKEHFAETVTLATPVVIGQLGFVLMGVVDSIMVGEIGAVPLAAASIANSVVILIYILGVGVSFAITPLVAIAVGAEKLEECGRIFRQSLLICTAIGVILALIIIAAAQAIPFLNQPENVAKEAIPYTMLLGLSILPAMIFMSVKQSIEGLSIMRPAMVIVLFANGVNIFVNWLLIYGNWGLPELGLNGAGWATISARVFMMIALIIYVFKYPLFKKYNFNLRYQGVDIPTIKKILKLGLPSGFQYFFEVGAFSFAAVMVGWLGTKELAAHQIAINLSSISFMGALGLSTAGGIRVGNAVGKKNVDETRRAGFAAILTAVFYMLIAALIFIAFRKTLPSIYIDDETVISLASTVMIIAALFQISDGVQAIGVGILRGLTDIKGPTIITFIAYWIIGLPSGYMLGFTFGMGIVGVWIGLSISLTASAIMLTFRFAKKSKEIVNI